jgi:AraC family transcriptional regulator of adaptative response/methylated-DNA-[protein]-cysteine methyltransferase
MPIELNSSRAEEPSDRWDKVCARDADADGEFIFAVKTTGVYCRPSCPSRRPNRKNVEFYVINSDAEEAGYRPCKRCKPTEISVTQSHALVVERACRNLEASDSEPNLEELSKQASMSKYHFQRVFKTTIGLTPKQYRAAVSQSRMRDALHNSSTVTQAIYESGHDAASRFYDTAMKSLGMTPSVYLAGAKGEVIVYAFAECWMGTVSVAISRKGICAVRLSDTQEQGKDELLSLFPHAILIFGAGDVEEFVASVTVATTEPKTAGELPLDIRGTAFQQRVWSALRDIPIGSTSTYSDVADAIGAPKSVRAVARACAANPVAVFVPCHRVVRADGGLGGYRWGVERKRQLLDQEAAA